MKSRPDISLYLVARDGEVYGVVPHAAAYSALDPRAKSRTIDDMLRTDFLIVDENARLQRVLADLRMDNGSIALVRQAGGAGAPDQLVGMITETQIADTRAKTVDLIAV